MRSDVHSCVEPQMRLGQVHRCRADERRRVIGIHGRRRDVGHESLSDLKIRGTAEYRDLRLFAGGYYPGGIQMERDFPPRHVGNGSAHRPWRVEEERMRNTRRQVCVPLSREPSYGRANAQVTPNSRRTADIEPERTRW